MKKTLSAILALVLVLTCASFPAFSSDETAATLTAISSSSPFGENTTDKAVDGAEDTFFATNGYIDPPGRDASSPYVLKYDLGEIKTLTELELYWSGSGWGFVPADKYKIYVSKDDSTYTEILSYEGLCTTFPEYDGKIVYSGDKTGANFKARVTESDLFVRDVRYIKIEIIAWKYRAALAEIKATVRPADAPAPVTYTVNFVDVNGNPITSSKTVSGNFVGDVVTETAPNIEGYVVDVTSKSITLTEGTNTINFVYTGAGVPTDFEPVPEIRPITSVTLNNGIDQDSNNTAQKLFDGNPATGYISGWKNANTNLSSANYNLVLTLDDYYDLSQINVLWGGDFGWWGEGTLTGGSIQVSTNGTDYRTVYTYNSTPAGESNGNNGFVREDETVFSAVAKNVKYVRINVTRISTSYLVIREITFNGVKHLDSSSKPLTNYTINYLDVYGNPISPAEDNIPANAGDIIIANAKEIDGYRPSFESVSYILGTNAQDNIVNFIYTKKATTSYTVRYLDEDGNPVADPKTVTDVYVDDTYIEEPLQLIDKGYLVTTPQMDTAVIPTANAANNVVTYTYKKVLVPDAITHKSVSANGDSRYSRLCDGLFSTNIAQYVVDKGYTPDKGRMVEYVLHYEDLVSMSSLFVYTNSNRATEVNIYVSTDGTNWGEPKISATVSDVATVYTYADGSTTTVHSSEFIFPEKTAGNYVKYEVLNITGDYSKQDYWCGIYEFALVGEKTTLAEQPQLAGTSLGGQIRLPVNTATAGLRFGVQIDKTVFGEDAAGTSYDYAAVAEKGIKVGMFILPTSMLGENKTLAEYFSNGGTQMMNVPAKRVYKEDDQTVTFTAVVTNIPETEYKRELVAVPYIYINGEYTFYAEMTKTYYGVAEGVATSYENGKITLTAKQKTFIENILGRTITTK